MSARDTLPARLFIDEQMTTPELMELGRGTLAVYSGRMPGKVGPNEDSAAAFEIEGGAVLVVCDGLGGLAAGEAASRLTIETLAEAIRGVNGPLLMREAILGGIEAANRAVLELGVGAGTTLVVAEIHGNTLRSYHVGDSQLLLIGPQGALRYITIAHSPVGYAVEAGMLDVRAALFHEDRHLISNMIGIDGMHVDMGPAIDLQAGDTFLLGTDGIFDNLHTDEIIDLVRRGSVAAATAGLVSACKSRMAGKRPDEPSKPDDHTLMLWRA